MDSSGECFYEEENVNIWQEPRREPLGAPRESHDNLCDEGADGERSHAERLHALEEEQEILSSSVFSLTSHLAQVEFRLRQIQKAPPNEKDEMLKALEEFTSRGVGGRVGGASGDGAESAPTCTECLELDDKLRRQRTKQMRYVEQLKTQLKELERFAGSAGAEECLARHRLMINNLKSEMNRSLKENCHQPLTADELRHQINCAVRQYANRQVSKDEIVSKLQAHIGDMQQFIKLMKNEALATDARTLKKETSEKEQPKNVYSKPQRSKHNDDIKAETINLMRKASALIQIFTVSQFGCSPKSSRQQEHSSTIVAHWGNLRAKLEMSIDAVLNLVAHNTPTYSSGLDSYDSDSEENTVVLNNVPLTTAVRKHLAVNLRDLLQHGLEGTPEGGTLVPFIGCFPVRRSSTSHQLHIWELILKYYEINNGDTFNSTPARKLSQSFNLDIVGGTAISNKQSLLGVIGTILGSHTPYKRSYDAHFKAFVCAALNAHKLVAWLNIILKSKSLVNVFYNSTSYVVNTGFQDSLQSLDRITPYNFDLPVDLAVKQFQNIKDVFM